MSVKIIFFSSDDGTIIGTSCIRKKREKGMHYFFLGSWGCSDGDMRQKFHVGEKHTFSDMEILLCKVPVDMIDTYDVQ